jgi:predicted N-acetyltransferase YhbS
VADAVGAVVGYYTLVAAQIDHSDATPEVRRGMSKRFPIPVVLHARLAIASRCQGQGLGAELLTDALRRSVRAAEEVGVRAVVVDALDLEAAGFYRRFGLQPVTDDGLTLMATVAQLRRADA